ARNFNVNNHDFVEDMIAPCLRNDHDKEQAYRVALVARKCVDRDVHRRPRMKMVVHLLENQVPVDFDAWSAQEDTQTTNDSFFSGRGSTGRGFTIDDWNFKRSDELDDDGDDIQVTVDKGTVTELIPR
ncbi:hypothetical protein CBR_g88234, partial [Chara braunii]